MTPLDLQHEGTVRWRHPLCTAGYISLQSIAASTSHCTNTALDLSSYQLLCDYSVSDCTPECSSKRACTLVIWCYNLLRCTVQEHSPTIFVIFKWRQHQHQRQILQMVGGDFWSRILSVLRFVHLKIQQLCPVTWFEPKPKRCCNDKIRAPVVSKVFHQDLYLHLPQSNTTPVPIIITMSSFPCWGTLFNSARLN